MVFPDNIQRRMSEFILRTLEKNRLPQVFYGNLAIYCGREEWPHEFDSELGGISIWCKENGLPFISALVINSKTNRPGLGYWGIYSPKVPECDKERIWQKEIEAILNRGNDWKILADQVGYKWKGLWHPRGTDPKAENIPEDSKDNLAASELPLEDAGIQEDEVKGEVILANELTNEELKTLIEGAKKVVTVNAYERNIKAREGCLKKYGTKCWICGFDASKVYGSEYSGKIEVHHLTPISSIGKEYEIALDDLRPVCPNCHMIIHANRNHILSIEDVQDLLAAR
jgi:hypothetical protein